MNLKILPEVSIRLYSPDLKIQSPLSIIIIYKDSGLIQIGEPIMVGENVLLSIRSAEKRAVELRELAERESQKTIEAAQKKAMAIIASSQASIEIKNEADIKKFYAELKKQKDAAVSEGARAAEIQKKAGQKKLSIAVDFLLQEFQKEVESA